MSTGGHLARRLSRRLLELEHCAVPLVEVTVLVVGLVGVGQFEIEEAHLLVLEERAGVPGAAVELDRHVAGNPERLDVLQRRLCLRVVDLRGRRHRDEPRFAADRGEALGDLAMARDLLDAHGPARQPHDVEARRAARKLELRVLGAERGAVLLRLDHRAVGRKRRGREIIDDNGTDCGFGIGTGHGLILRYPYSAALSACGKFRSLSS